MSDVSMTQSDSYSVISAPVEEADEDEDQEFYIWSTSVFWESVIWNELLSSDSREKQLYSALWCLTVKLQASEH